MASLKLGDNQHSKEAPSIEGASEALNVGHVSVERAKKIKAADKELFKKVKSGEVSVNAAVTSLKPVQSYIYRELRNDVP